MEVKSENTMDKNAIHMCLTILSKLLFLLRIQAAETGFQAYYWSSRTAYPQLIQ